MSNTTQPGDNSTPSNGTSTPALKTAFIILFSLLFTGLITRPLIPTYSDFDTRSEYRTPTPLVQGSPGLGLAALGGWRTIAADFLWLRVQAAWEKRDMPATYTAIQLVTQMDPRPLIFWLNGARMLAYDMPEWRIEAAGGFDNVPVAWRDKVYAEHAQLGLALLSVARAHLGDRHALWVEAANILAKKVNDLDGAAACYKQAARQPDAPFYVARLHAEMLRRAGKQAEALEYLVALHPTLPTDNEQAMADVVLSRIRELENALQIAPQRRYNPPSPKH